MARIPFRILSRFLRIIVPLAALLVWYSASRLCAPLAPGSPFHAAIWSAVILVWCFPFLRIFSMNHGGFQRPLAIGFYFVGLAAMLVIGFLVMDLSGLILKLAGSGLPERAPWAVAGASFIFSLLGLGQALQGPAVKQVDIRKAGLPGGLQGLRIVQISDLHVTGQLGEAYVRQVVDSALALKPDLIAITGDLIDGPREELREAVRPLADLKAPLGVHFVTGNHEYSWGAAAWMDDLRALGFQVLDNAHRAFNFRGANLLVVGINDHSAGRMGSSDRPDVAKAMQGAPQADFTLFLAHQPQAYVQAEQAKADLMLAGHTHAGQFYPFPGIVRLFHRYFNGLYRHEGKFWIYVNPGAGYWGPPNRLGVPTEITLLELKSA